MFKKVFAVLLVVVFFNVSFAFAATAEEEAALEKLVLQLSTQAVHEARVREDIGYEDVYDQTAMAFSRLQCPEYKEEDRPIVEKAFGAAFEEKQLRTEWIEMMSARISKMSDGKASLEVAAGSAILDLMPVPYGVVKVVAEHGSTTYVITPTSLMGCEDKKVNETRYSLLE